MKLKYVIAGVGIALLLGLIYLSICKSKIEVSNAYDVTKKVERKGYKGVYLDRHLQEYINEISDEKKINPFLVFSIISTISDGSTFYNKGERYGICGINIKQVPNEIIASTNKDFRDVFTNIDILTSMLSREFKKGRTEEEVVKKYYPQEAKDILLGVDILKQLNEVSK